MRIRWRGLELPSKVIADQATLTDTFGRFHVEPFEQGFGVTVHQAPEVGHQLAAFHTPAILRLELGRLLQLFQELDQKLLESLLDHAMSRNGDGLA